MQTSSAELQHAVTFSILSRVSNSELERAWYSETAAGSKRHHSSFALLSKEKLGNSQDICARFK